MEETSADGVAQQHQRQTSANFQNPNNSAEDEMLGSVGAIVKQNDRRAIEMGRQLGQRFNRVMFAAMMPEMGTGLTQMH